MNPPLTPYVRIDQAKALNNIRRFQAYCDKHEIRLRPHIKTHKTVALAQAQVEAGAVGITCQKITEAEVFARAGFDDIMVTYNLLGPERLARLAKLRQKATMSVIADHPQVIQGLANADLGSSDPLPVCIEVDTGSKRCGITHLQDLVQLAKLTAAQESLHFAGLMTYPLAGKPAEADRLLGDYAKALAEEGLPCEIITSGGSPDMWQAHLANSVTEYRVGTYVYYDRSLLNRGVCELQDCALTVKTTVVSVQGDRFVVDAGSKALTSDLQGCQGHGLILEYPEATIHGLSEEHGHVNAARCPTRPNIGDVVTILPNHACPVSNLFDTVWVVEPQGQGALRKVDARGCVG